VAYLLGCDAGTGGAKSVIINEQGQALGSHFVEYPLRTPRPGIAEQDPEDFWKASAETIRVSLEKAKVRPQDIAAVSVSAQSPASILVDKSLKALRPAHIWMDRRAVAQCQWLKDHIGVDRVRAVTGNDVIDPYFGLTKIMWDRDNEPELYRRAIKSINQKDFVAMRLTGEICTDPSNATLGGIAFDARKKDWDPELLKDIGLDRSKLPDVRPSREVIGSVTGEAAALCGLMPGTPVANGVHDGAAAWLSMGTIDYGDNVLSLGSSAIWAIAHEDPVTAPGLLHTENVADPNTYITFGATSSAGALLRWFRDQFGGIETVMGRRLGVDPYGLLTKQAEAIPPGSDGLIILPYFMGERMPVWDCTARGVMFGLSLAHTRGHVIRALMESACYTVCHILTRARHSGIALTKPTAMVEGGARCAFWRQLVSDVCDVHTVFMAGAEGAPVGDAIIAGVSVGLFDSYRVVKNWLKYSDHTQPDPAKHALYQQLFELYLKLYESQRSNFKELNSIYSC
jgi:xylulokinase